MNWQQGSIAQQYTLIGGGYQALVWHQTTGEWAALISRDNVAVDSHVFKTLNDARVWCETHLTGLQTSHDRHG